jgi:O-antigen ligase
MGERVIGRGTKVQGVSAESPLSAASIVRNRKAYPVAIINGDTVLEVDGQRVHSAEELAASLDATHDSKPAHVKIYRTEWIPTLEVPRARLLPGNSAEQRLGISGWTRGRDWRASGFYGHYATYAEVLQLVAALAVGLFVSLSFKRNWAGALLMAAIAGLGFSLLLTVTRASWLAFLISTAVILLVGASRRAIITVGLLAVPLVLAGLFVLHQKRKVGFFDKQDGSISWRETVWHEGFSLLVRKPRHLLVGVGMDSIKAHWREWGLFDEGRLPIGHMHSNLLQIALERGLPALIAWFLLLGVYIRLLWRLNGELGKNHMDPRGAKEKIVWMKGPSQTGEWIDRGIVLGALGGTLGFFASGLVHYNWGDSEVVMIFYFLMGLSLALRKQAKLATA